LIEFVSVDELKSFIDYLSQITQFDINYLKNYFYITKYRGIEKYKLDNSIFFDKYLRFRIKPLHTRTEIQKILSKYTLGISEEDIEYIFNKVSLLEHQKEFLKQIKYIFSDYPTQLKHMAYLLSDDVGSGKTIQSLSTSLLLTKKFQQMNKNFITFIFTNISIKEQIYSEIKKFKLQDELFPIIINNKKDLYYFLTEYENLMVKPNVVITHYELLRNTKTDMNDMLLTDLQNFLKHKIDVVFFILDEASKLKNRDTDLYKQMFKLITSTNQSYTLLVTATPIENNLLDISNIFHLGFGGLIMNPHWIDEKFIVYGIIKNNKSNKRFNQVKVVKHYKNLKFFKNFLDILMLRRSKNELNISLPDLTEYYVKIPELDKYQLELMKILMNDIETKLDYDKPTKSLIAYIYIRQIVNSPKMLKMINQNETLMKELSNFKSYINSLDLDKYMSPKEISLNNLLIEIFRSTDNKRVLIFSFYERMSEIIYNTLSKMYKNVYIITGQLSQYERNRIVKMTKEKKSCILIATDSLSYGVNLQHFDYLVNFDLPYNPSRLYQRIGRIHRIGGENEKTIFNLFTPFEERVVEILKKKSELIQYMIHENKETHKKVFTEITDIYYNIVKKIISKVS